MHKLFKGNWKLCISTCIHVGGGGCFTGVHFRLSLTHNFEVNCLPMILDFNYLINLMHNDIKQIHCSHSNYAVYIYFV